MGTIFDNIRKDISPDLIPDHDKFVKVNIRNKEEDRVYENGVCKLCYYCFCIEYKNGHLTSLLQLLILMLRYQNQWMATRCYIHVLIKLAVCPKKGTTLTWWCIILQFHYWHFYWNVVNIPISYMVVMSIIEIWIYKKIRFSHGNNCKPLVRSFAKNIYWRFQNGSISITIYSWYWRSW